MSIDELVARSAGCRLPLDQARSLPPGVYHDQEWYELERTRLFHTGWVAVARSSELAEPNRFITATIADEPCIVVRRRDGSLSAMSNVCLHRQTVIVGDQAGSAPSLQCPYHLWTYGHDGRLKAAPGMDRAAGFDIVDFCLPEFAVEEWQGFVLVNVDGKAPLLSGTAPTLDALFTVNRIAEVVSVGSRTYPSPWNWKISVENFLESYHHGGVHPETLDATYPWRQSFAVLAGDEPWSGVDHVSVVADNEPFIALAAYPSLLIAVNRGLGMFWFRLDPQAVDRTNLTIEAFVLPELAGEPDIGELMLSSVEEINDEDIAINERTAAGLRSRFAQPGPVSHLEASPWHFRRWLLERMET